MATTSYFFSFKTAAVIATASPGGTPGESAPALMFDGGDYYRLVSNDDGLDQLDVTTFIFGNNPSTNTPGSDITSTVSGNQSGARLTGLAGGSWAMAFNDTSTGSGQVRVRIFDKFNNAQGADFQIANVTGTATLGGIATLSNGNFAVIFQNDFSATDQDVRVRIFDASGNTVTSTLGIEASAAVDAIDPSIAALAGGGFAAVWTEVQADGSQDLYHRRYDNAGTALAAKKLVDTGGTINSEAEAIGLKDGGYAFVYRDNGWGGAFSGSDITLRIYNADGTARTGFINATQGASVLDQTKPSISLLANGFIQVAWTSFANGATDIKGRIFDPNGTAVTSVFTVAESAGAEDQSASQGLHSGVMAFAWTDQSSAFDGESSGVGLRLAGLSRWIDGDGTDETLTGDELSDTITGNGGTNIIDGAGGDDFINGGDGLDTLSGGGGRDILNYSASPEGVVLNALANVAAGGFASGDTIGFDSFEELRGSDAGTDVITGGHGGMTLRGFGGADTIMGGDGSDVLLGGDGDDHLAHSKGADIFMGEGGYADWVDYSPASGGVTVTLSASAVNGGEAAGDQVNDDIECAMGSWFDDSITGNFFDNTLDGGKGDDVLEGRAGDDQLIGGEGIDTAAYTAAGVGVAVNLDVAGAQDTGEGLDTLSLIENISGGGLDDTLTGDGGKNTLSGLAGADTLAGGAGNDTLDGGAGADTMAGGENHDIYYADNAADVVTEALNQGIDTVLTSLDSYTLGANVERVLYTGSDNFTGQGNDLDNRLRGGIGNDRFNADTGGADVFIGGAGDDNVRYTGVAAAIINFATLATGGSAVGDTFSGIEAIYGSNTGNDELTAATEAMRFYGQAGEDKLTGGSGIDTLYGGAGSDTLKGAGGGDTILGEGDNDNISGGAAADLLYGGAGSDSFAYADIADSTFEAAGRDIIADFDANAADKLDLSAIDAIAGGGLPDDAFTFMGNGAFTGLGQIRVTLGATYTYVHVNSAGTLDADMVIALKGIITLDAADFAL